MNVPFLSSRHDRHPGCLRHPGRPVFLVLLPVLLIAALLLSLLSFPASAIPAVSNAPDNSGAHILLLYSFFDQTVLYSKNASSAIAPGATAKLMTALLVLEACPDLSRTVTLTSTLIAGNRYPDCGFVEDATVPLHDLLAALVIGNVNSAAGILARWLDGTAEAFTERMNRRAEALGMTGTHYENPTGLDEEGAVTNANDVLTLALTLSDFPAFTDLAALARITLSTGKDLYSRNYLVGRWVTKAYYYENATGMNAGSTQNSGNTLVATAKETDQKTYLCIVLGAETRQERNCAYDIATSYFRWAPTAFAYRTVIRSSTPMGFLPVKEGNGQERVAVFPGEDVSRILPKTVTDEEISFTCEWEVSELTAPVEKGKEVGRVRAFWEDKEIASCALVTGNRVTRDPSAQTKETLWEIFRGLLLFLLPPLILFLAVLAVLIVRKKHRQKRR